MLQCHFIFDGFSLSKVPKWGCFVRSRCCMLKHNTWYLVGDLFICSFRLPAGISLLGYLDNFCFFCYVFCCFAILFFVNTVVQLYPPMGGQGKSLLVSCNRHLPYTLVPWHLISTFFFLKCPKEPPQCGRCCSRRLLSTINLLSTLCFPFSSLEDGLVRAVEMLQSWTGR